SAAFKTLEYEIALANIASTKTDFATNFLIAFLAKHEKAKYAKIEGYMIALPTEAFSPVERQKLAIIVWKALPSKAAFAQHFSLELELAVQNGDAISFVVPPYLEKSINHVTAN